MILKKLFLGLLSSLLFVIFLGVEGNVWGQTSPAIYTYLATAQTFTVPAGVTSITVECWGAGGGGAKNYGGGGGGGAYASSVLTVTPGTTFTVFPGKGGASQTNGGDSYFGSTSTVMAKGGVGATATTGALGGAAGSSVGTTKNSGGSWGNGQNSFSSYGGSGGGVAGASSVGGNGTSSGGVGQANPGGNGNGADRKIASGAGNLGYLWGGGGGGAYGNYNGGNGGVKITWATPTLTLTTVNTTPSPLCLDQQGQVIVNINNATGSNIGATSDFKLQYSIDNGVTWLDAVLPIANINNGATNGYSFNFTPSTTPTIPMKMRIVKISDGSTVNSNDYTLNVNNCNPQAVADCANAPLIQTNSTYIGYTGNMPVVTSDPSKTWLNDVVSGLTIENVGYFKFVASASGTVKFKSCSDCSIQHAIFPTCGTKSGSVFAVLQMGPGVGSLTTSGPSVSYTNLGGGCYEFTVGSLTPHQTYYWAVDGYSGANCNYSIQFTNGISVLPIELKSFNGECVNGNIEFHWITGSETNNDYFTLQQSVDGNDWNDVANIPGAGNSAQERFYSYTDRSFYNQKVNYFRIKQTDFDGRTTYKNPISVMNCNANYQDFEVIPNPNNGLFAVHVDNPENMSEIVVYDVTGKIIYSLDNVQTQQSINLGNHPKGLYLIGLQHKDGSRSMQRVVLE